MHIYEILWMELWRIVLQILWQIYCVYLCLCVFAYSTHFLNLNAPFDGLFSDRRGFERFFHFNLCHNDDFVFVFVFSFLRLLWNYFLWMNFFYVTSQNFLCQIFFFPSLFFTDHNFFSFFFLLAKSYFFFFCITLLYIYIFFLCNIINYY